jgi:hypothetical protein
MESIWAKKTEFLGVKLGLSKVFSLMDKFDGNFVDENDENRGFGSDENNCGESEFSCGNADGLSVKLPE